MEVVSTFLMTTRNAGVLVDGIETLSEMNGFDKVMAFVKKLNDLARTHGSTIILSANKKLLTESQFKALSEAFDEVHDFQ
jgi:archaellum biogenesis ATPase FlaH